jgi:hypothetical protein
LRSEPPATIEQLVDATIGGEPEELGLWIMKGPANRAFHDAPMRDASVVAT